MSAPLGLIIYAAVKPIFKIYFIIGLGFFMAKRNILTVTTSRDISDLIVTAIMPCLIFNNVVSNLVSSDIKFLGIIFFLGTLLFAVGALLGLLTHYVCKSPKKWFGGLISVGLFPNISDLPIAYLQTLSKTGSLFTTEEGNKGVAYVCIFLASQVFYQFSLGLFKLVRYDFRDQLAAAAAAEADAEILIQSDNSSSTRAIDDDKHNASPSDHSRSNESPSPDATGFNRRNSDLGSIDSADLEPRQLSQPQNLSTSHRRGSVQSRDTEASRSIHSDVSVRTKHRRGTLSSSVIDNPLRATASRNGELRSTMSQDIDDVINEYSEFNRLRSRETSHLPSGAECAVVDTEDALVANSKPPVGREIRRHVITMLKNFLAPNSVSLITSLAIAMAPPLRALFVKGNFSMPSAPDKQPPLSFMIDIASYVGAASVPLGLLILGATIARLKVNAIIPGFWKTALMITACRLIILPIFGVGVTTGLQNAGWFGEDRLIRFVSVLEYGLPNATALVYFTAFYTDPDSPDHLQMDCLAICLIAQYSVLFITLPFLVTFSLKVSMGF